MIVVEKLIELLRNSAVYNPDTQSAPVCILWPDKESQFESIIKELQAHLPELFILGEYAPESKTGPAIWLRCVLSNKIEDIELPKELIPILYLPGVGRQDLRAVESCPDNLKPLAELQYRGVIWSQINAKDWTILSLLKSDQGGFALDVAQDTSTKDAMKLALGNFLEEDVELLRGKRLDKDYFNSLLSGGDPIRDLLQWMNLGDEFVQKRSENEWNAFNAICKSQFGFIPKSEGQLAAAEKLALHNGVWQPIWERYREAPLRYKNIPQLIRNCKMPSFDLFAGVEEKGNWPQWNEDEEKQLLSVLNALGDKPEHKAREALIGLEEVHGERRNLVWAELGESLLAQAIKPLSVLAQITTESLAVGTTEDIFSKYTDAGWKADDAVLQALSYADDTKSFEAISIAIRAVYLPWAQESARYLQKVASESNYPGETIESASAVNYKDSECVLFVDGLRFDTAKRLVSLLENRGLKTLEKPYWNPLPSVTATGKPSVSPVRNKIKGIEENTDFEPSVAETGQDLNNYHFKKLLKEAGWKILERNDSGDGTGNAWCEFGDIDHEGHDRGWKLAKHVDNLLSDIDERIGELLSSGWKTVRVVTDHGWLLLPGGLPKIELPSVLTNSKWGRCAVLKKGAKTEERVFPWYWNAHQHFVLADGISCFKKGDEYNHGGLSVQECIVLEIAVSNESASLNSNTVELTDVAWKGLRCTVAADGEFSGLKVDIRLEAGNAASSVVVSKKTFKTNGTASVVVEDEDLEGEKAYVVLLDESDGLAKQQATVIGGGE